MYISCLLLVDDYSTIHATGLTRAFPHTLNLFQGYRPGLVWATAGLVLLASLVITLKMFWQAYLHWKKLHKSEHHTCDFIDY